MRFKALGAVCGLLVVLLGSVSPVAAQGTIPVADTSEYRAATYGAPTKYASPTRALTSPGAGTLADPWNLLQAESLAVCGDRVGIMDVGTGTPVAMPVPSIYQEPAFNPTASCTASNPLVYVTRFPAVMLDKATASTDPRRSEIRTNGTRENNDVRGTGRAAYGMYQRHHIVYDGLYSNMVHVGINGDQGVITARSSTGCKFLNAAIDGMTTNMDSNAVLYRPDNTRDCVVSNIWIRNFRNQPTGGGLNQPGWVSDQYGDQNYLIEFYDLENVDNGWYPKGTAVNGTVFNYGTIRFGVIRGAGQCLRLNDYDPVGQTVIHHNLFIGCSVGWTFDNQTTAARNVLAHHNTVVVTACSSGGACGPVYVKQGRGGTSSTVTVRDNLFVLLSSSGHLIEAGEASWIPTLAHNGYVRTSGLSWSSNGREYSTLDAWRAGTGQDGTSRVLASDPFVDRAAGNYRIRAGHEALTASSTNGELGAYAGATTPPPPPPPPPPCTFTIAPTSASQPATASTGTVTVTASASTCTWSAVSGASWVTTSSSGTGSGAAAYSVSANTGASRSGTVTIAGQSFAVTQAAGTTPAPCGSAPTDYTPSAVVTQVTGPSVYVTWTLTGCNGVVVYRAETRTIRQ